MFDCDRAALRPAQSRSERRARSAVASARGRGAGTRRQDGTCARSVHGHGRSGDRDCDASPGCIGDRCRLFRSDACASDSARCGWRRAGSRGSGSSVATPREYRSWARTCDAATIAFGIRNVAEPERALARAGAGSCVRVLAWRSSSSASRGSRASARSTRLVFPLSATCRGKARLASPERLLVPARFGRYLPATCRVRSDHRKSRLCLGASRPADVRHRLSVSYATSIA